MKNELRIPSPEKLQEMLELAQLGKNARVIFHDLSNHLTALTLSMEHVTHVLRSHLENSSSETFEIRTEIKKIIQTFEARARDQRVICNLSCRSNTKLHGDSRAFTHILTNLISNAFDSFQNCDKNRTRKITISTATSKKNIGHMKAGTVVLSVSDTGSGILAQDIPHIFDKNFTTKKSGHGIGLVAVKEFVEESFNGKISVQSSEAGTRFDIYFPAR